MSQSIRSLFMVTLVILLKNTSTMAAEISTEKFRPLVEAVSPEEMALSMALWLALTPEASYKDKFRGLLMESAAWAQSGNDLESQRAVERAEWILAGIENPDHKEIYRDLLQLLRFDIESLRKNR